MAPSLPFQVCSIPVHQQSHMESPADPRLGRSVSIARAAEFLSVSRRTVYYRIREGRLQTIRTLGGSQRVLVESLYSLGFRPEAFPARASTAAFAGAGHAGESRRVSLE